MTLTLAERSTWSRSRTSSQPWTSWRAESKTVRTLLPVELSKGSSKKSYFYWPKIFGLKKPFFGKILQQTCQSDNIILQNRKIVRVKNVSLKIGNKIKKVSKKNNFFFSTFPYYTKWVKTSWTYSISVS